MSAIEEISKKTTIDMTNLEYACWDLHNTESGNIGELAAEELAAMQARIAELEAEDARKAFRLNWIKENYDDTTALRFALKADNSEIDEMIASAK